MPIKNYQLYPSDSGALLPYIWTAISYKSTTFHFYALIDTGAEECHLPASAASKFDDLKLKSGKPRSMITANREVKGYEHECRIEILETLPNCMFGDGLCPQIVVPIIFLETCEIPLLGSKKFLKHFKLTVDYPQQKFSLQLPKSV